MSLTKIFVNNTEVTAVDEKPTINSENLVLSRGIYDADQAYIEKIKNIDFSANTTLIAPGSSSGVKIPGPFKAGTKILLSTNNFFKTLNPEGYQDAVVYITDSSGVVLQVRGNSINEFTLLVDSDLICCQTSIGAGVASLSCDVILAIGTLEITKFKTELGYGIIPVAESADNSIKGQIVSDMLLVYEQGKTSNPKRIYSDFKLGSIITMTATEYNIPSAGNHHVRIIAHFTDNTTTNAIILYNKGKGSYTFAKNADYIDILMGYEIPQTTDFSVKVSVRYGSLVDEIKEIDERISETINEIDFSLNDTLIENQHIQIPGPFKAGTNILLSTNNFFKTLNPEGHQDGVVYVNDTFNFIVTSRGNNVIEYTLLVDCPYLTCGINIAPGVAALSCDVILAVGSLEITKFKAECGYDIIPVGESADNSIKGQVISDMALTYEQGKTSKPKRIYGDFEQGTTITMEATEYNTPSVGNHHVRITAYFTDNTLENAIVLFNVGKGSYTFPKDADHIDIVMGYQYNTTDYSAKVSIRYGSLANDINSIYERISDISYVADSKTTIFMEQLALTVSDWIYKRICYVGFNKPFTKKSLLKLLTMHYWSATTNNIGDSRTLVVGTIDLRNWLLIENEYTIIVKDVMSGNVTFDLNNIEVQPGQVVFLKSEGFSTERPEVNFGVSDASYDAENPVYYTYDLDVALNTYNRGLKTYKLETVEIDSIFITEKSLNNINQNINALQQETNKINSYTDVITNEPYKIKIVNGLIIAQLLNFQRILVIGHSFVVYGNSPAADWYLPNGQSRAMAPSVFDNEWAAYVAEKYGGQFTKMGGVDFERNYSPSYNFASNWNIQDNWDAICVYLCENATYNDTMQASWEAMLNYLKAAAPHAEIFCTASWTAGDKATAIAAACASVPNINYVNLIGLNDRGNLSWNVGDYYIGRDDKYLPMGAPAGHPSDIGHLVIANEFLEKMGQMPFDNKTKNVILNQSGGGTISTRSLELVIGSVVSIKCVGDSGKYISGMTVTDANGNNVVATLRVNGSDVNNPKVYYTFIMPNSDATITPTWSNTKNYTTYITTISDTSGGNIKNLNAVCLEGTRCYMYVTPNSGKALNSISATTSGSSVTLTADGDRCYYFDMPAANVTITPVWGNV